jgi:hypothetical protein
LIKNSGMTIGVLPKMYDSAVCEEFLGRLMWNSMKDLLFLEEDLLHLVDKMNFRKEELWRMI